MHCNTLPFIFLSTECGCYYFSIHKIYSFQPFLWNLQTLKYKRAKGQKEKTCLSLMRTLYHNI